MAIIKNVELYYCKLDPKRPNANFNKASPTWEAQIRTRDKEVAKKWKEMDLNVKLMEGEGDTGVYYRVNLKKKSIKEDETPASPVTLVDGKLQPLDPNSIGNGSIGHVRVFQHDYEFNGKKGIASILMAIQVIKHVIYVPKPREDDFSEEDMETVMPEDDGKDPAF